MKLPAPQVVFDLGQHGLILGVAGPAPHPDRDALAGDRQPDHDLRQVVAVVLGLAVAAKPADLILGILLLVAFEVGGGGVEEQQVHLQVEQVRDREEHRLLHPGLRVGLHQQIHRPVRLVVVHAAKARDDDVLACPRGRPKLAHRLDRPVGDQRTAPVPRWW